MQTGIQRIRGLLDTRLRGYDSHFSLLIPSPLWILQNAEKEDGVSVKIDGWHMSLRHESLLPLHEMLEDIASEGADDTKLVSAIKSAQELISSLGSLDTF